MGKMLSFAVLGQDAEWERSDRSFNYAFECLNSVVVYVGLLKLGELIPKMLLLD